jgi:hypothetical protein
LSPSWHPVAPDELAERLAAWLARSPGTVRVAIDGPPAARPDQLAEELIEALRPLGRPAVHVRASTFWRDASLRYEHGREDIDSYREWLDAGALRREVLDPAVERGSYLPSLRDPDTNRSTRAQPRSLARGSVVLVSGALLLGSGLPFDRAVHLALSPAARVRRTPADLAWTLPAFDRYDTHVQPIANADVVIKWDDRLHPAVRGLRGSA